MRGETVGPRSVATAGWGEASRRAAFHQTIPSIRSYLRTDTLSLIKQDLFYQGCRAACELIKQI